MKTPVYDALKALQIEDSVSFHFPGHKNRIALVDWSKHIPQIDTTEAEGMDNLLEPRTIIKQSQEEAAKVYGSIQTLYCVNGSTGSMYIALSTLAEPGDHVLVQRNCHKSVYNGLILNQLTPSFIYPHYNEEHNLYSGVDYKEVERAIKENPHAKLVVLTYPNYYGVCYDLEKIAKLIHDNGMMLIVDEAHGPHMVFSDLLPKSALECGADMVIESTHKTLPSFTQTSLLHVGSDKVDLAKLRERYTLYTTTSPSYLFTCSNETASAFMDSEGRERFKTQLPMIRQKMKEMAAIPGVSVFDGDASDPSIRDMDYTKILISIDGMRGTTLKKRLYAEHNIRLEMADYYHSLIMTSVMNTEEDFDKLIAALKVLAEDKNKEAVDFVSLDMPRPHISMSPFEAFHSEREIINLKDSIGRICSSPIIPYPPGVPLLAPGEMMTEEVYKYLGFLMDNDINVVGLKGDDLDRITVVK